MKVNRADDVGNFAKIASLYGDCDLLQMIGLAFNIINGNVIYLNKATEFGNSIDCFCVLISIR